MKIFNTRAPLRLKGLVLRVVYIYIWCRGPFVYIKERVSSFRYKGTVCETNLCTAFMTMTCNVLNYSQLSMILFIDIYLYRNAIRRLTFYIACKNIWQKKQKKRKGKISYSQHFSKVINHEGGGKGRGGKGAAVKSTYVSNA